MDFYDWERMKIAGNTEQNRQIDEMRKSYEARELANAQQHSYDKIIQELRSSNELATKQAEEAKCDANTAKKKAFWASLRSWISLAITAGAFIISIIALCKQ